MNGVLQKFGRSSLMDLQELFKIMRTFKMRSLTSRKTSSIAKPSTSILLAFSSGKLRLARFHSTTRVHRIFTTLSLNKIRDQPFQAAPTSLWRCWSEDAGKTQLQADQIFRTFSNIFKDVNLMTANLESICWMIFDLEYVKIDLNSK